MWLPDWAEFRPSWQISEFFVRRAGKNLVGHTGSGRVGDITLENEGIFKNILAAGAGNLGQI